MTDLEPGEQRNQYQYQERVALIGLASTAALAETEVWTRQSKQNERKCSSLSWTKTHLVLGREPQDLRPWETGGSEIATCQFRMISSAPLSSAYL
jgi:hypothetical protein